MAVTLSSDLCEIQSYGSRIPVSSEKSTMQQASVLGMNEIALIDQLVYVLALHS